MGKRSRRRKARPWVNWGSSAPLALEPGQRITDPYMAVEQKGYSLVAMDAGRTALRGVSPTPSDRSLVRAVTESPWLNAKLVRVCSSIAMVDFEFGTEDQIGNFRVLPRTYPLWSLMRRPNSEMTGYDFRLLTMLYARTIGEVYWRVLRGGLSPVSLWIYPREWVTPIYSRDRLSVVSYEIRSRTRGFSLRTDKVPAQDMIWLRHPDPVDPYVQGVGEVLASATELDTFELASESDRRFFENDAQPPGALIVPGTPTSDERKRITDDWHEKIGGPERQGRIPVLSGGIDFKQFRQSRKEMDFIEGQVYLRDVIIRGVHKHIMGISDDVNLASAKAAEFTYARWELLPDVMWLQENINHRLAPLFDARAQIRFANPVPSDEAFELMKANEGLTRAAITRNEWRQAMGHPLLPPDKGDVFVMPIAVIETPATSPPREEAAPVNPNPRPDDNAPKPRPPGDQGARSKVTKPVGPYASFAECVAANQDKDDPEAYCAAIEARMGGVPNAPVSPHVMYDPAKPDANWYPTRKQLSPQEMRELLEEVVDDEEFGKALLAAYEAVIRGRFEDAVAEVGAEPSLDASSALTRRYMAEEAAVRVAGINEETRTQLREALDESIRLGENLRESADRVSAVYDEFKGDRAVLIARTETIDASSWTAVETYKTNGVDGKEWLLSPDYNADEDNGVCEEYEANGVVPVGEDFQGPEGPLDGPSAHPGCRCAVAPVVLEDTEGTVADASVAEESVEARDALEGVAGELGTRPPEGIDDQWRSHVSESSGGSTLQFDKAEELRDRVVKNWFGGSVKHEDDPIVRYVSATLGEKNSISEQAKLLYEFNQRTLARASGGADTVTLYRGITGEFAGKVSEALSRSSEVALSFKEIVPGGRVRAATSWTTNLDVARSFAKGVDGVVMESVVPIKDIVLSGMSTPHFVFDNITAHEFVVRHSESLVVRRAGLSVPKGAKRSQDMPVVGWPTDEWSWHGREYPKRPKRPRRNSRRGAKTTWKRLYDGFERKNARITALGREHTRMERIFVNVLRRALQAQQRALLREIRAR